MLDHIILSVNDVERSLAFYEAALKPLDIKFFLPYKGEGDHPDLWGFGDGKRAFLWIKQGRPDPASIHGGSRPKITVRSMDSTRRQYPLAPGTISHHEHDWSIIRDIMPPMYLIRTDIRSRSSIKVSEGISHVRECAMHEVDRDGTFTHGRCNALHIAGTNISNGKNCG